MKRLLFLFLLTPFLSAAQEKPLILIADGISPGLYVTHKVAAKENYYSIGRIYNVSPKEIAPFNNLQLENGLSLGQVIKIPLSAANFFQDGSAAADEIFVPVYHVVKGKEGLYRVALNHNNLPLETMKQWNNIKGDAVRNGTKLIVGYLKVKKDQSYLAKNGVATTINANVIAMVKTEEKTPDNVKKETVKPGKETVSAETKKTTNPGKDNAEGNFKNLYNLQSKNAEVVNADGIAGVFKSTSGWNDKKYYCLHNSALPGTIIKITNPATGKYVYAKVLDLMPDIKKNEGLLICISNAAAAELGADENNFNCVLNYAK